MDLFAHFPVWKVLAGAGVLALVVGIWLLVERILNPTSSPLDQPDVTAKLTGSCGETMQISLKIENGIVRSASYFTDGCGPIAACGGIATRLAQGQPLEKVVERVHYEAIEKGVGGLPEDKIHCAKLTAETLQEAVHRYYLEQRKTPSDHSRHA
jgi:nitrogen fixation NifU-like protein